MKNKKIVDYIILNGKKPNLNLFERTKSQIPEIEEKIHSYKKSIDSNKIHLKRCKCLFEEYESFKKLEEGKSYEVITREKLDEWKSIVDNVVSIGRKSMYGLIPIEHEFRHPLHKPYKFTGTVVFGRPYTGEEIKHYEDYKKSFVIIKGELARVEINLVSFKNEIEVLEKELEEYEYDPSPKSNSEIKPIFENQVLELLKMGYEPLGGVSVDRYYSYQAMVKYEE